VSGERQPMTDERLNEFAADGTQTRFAISPFGSSETRAERIERLEKMGVIEPGCAGCREFYAHPTLSPFAPRHRPGTYCQSGRRPHCTCPTCWG
jgi:hypothetical protein